MARRTRERHPVDVLTKDLDTVYRQAGARLEALVRDGITRGLDPSRAWTADAVTGDATLAYRARQLIRVRHVLKDLDLQTRSAVPQLTGASYRATVTAVDVTLGPSLGGLGGFGTLHTRVIDELAGNMAASLTKALKHTEASVELVFDRASALEGALPVNRAGDARHFLGRRLNDPWRAPALEELAAGKASLATRQQISESLARRLVTDGVTDGLTGFVDRAGRRWDLRNYTTMVGRTTMREASSRACSNRLLESGAGVVTISSHPHQADECTPYDGQTFAIRAEDAARDGLAMLDVYPPFHPQCRHVLTPGVGNLDTFEAELEGSIARLREDEEESYAAWREKEDRRGERERVKAYNAGYRCWNCKKFVTGKFSICRNCGYRPGGVHHPNYETR